MSRTNNRRIRTLPVQDTFTKSSPYHQRQNKRRSFDDSNIVYRNTPEYFQQLMNTSTLSNGSITKSLIRPSSANEMTPRNLGNPKYKAQEDYYDEIQLLKKELKYFKDDNNNLRARLRRLEEDNARKNKEIESFYDPTKDSDTRRTITSSSTSTNSVLMNLKQRLFKLEIQLKQKETIIDTMKNDPRWTKATEFEIQNRALFNEIEKQKIERLEFIRHNYMAAIDEEKKNAVRKLEEEKQELQIENDNLRKKLSDRDEQVSARRREDNIERELHRKLDHFKGLCRKYENDIEKLKDDLKDLRHERDKYQDKFDHMKEDLQEIKHQRDQYREKFERINEFDDRSSSNFKRHNEHLNKRGTLQKDQRPGTPVRSSMKSSQNIRSKTWTSDDDYRVEKFRRKHAATVIQRGWRHHHRKHKHQSDHFDNQNSLTSSYGSKQKLTSKHDYFINDSNKNRSNISTESALKIIQAALRGHMKRNELEKKSDILKFERKFSDDNNDENSLLERRFENERKQNHFFHYSKSDLRNESIHRDSPSRSHRTPSPSNEYHQLSSPRYHSNISESKTNLFHEQYKLNSGYRQSPHRTSSPLKDTHRSISPISKQSLMNDKNKLNSKQSMKTMSHDDDDDDILGF